MRRFLALLLAAVSQLNAQAAPSAHPVGFKDPGTATLLSVVVIGGGQMYSGEVNRGLALLGIGLGSLIVGEAAAVGGCTSTGSNGSPSVSNCSKGTDMAALGLLAYLGTWGYGVYDASHSAARHNATLATSKSASISPIFMPSRDGRTRVGLRFSVKR